MRSRQWLKWQANTTPIKNVTINGLKRPCTRQISTDSVQSEPATQPIPDLRLEAKMTAEVSLPVFLICFSIIAVTSSCSSDLSNDCGMWIT